MSRKNQTSQVPHPRTKRAGQGKLRNQLKALKESILQSNWRERPNEIEVGPEALAERPSALGTALRVAIVAADAFSSIPAEEQISIRTWILKNADGQLANILSDAFDLLGSHRDAVTAILKQLKDLPQLPSSGDCYETLVAIEEPQLRKRFGVYYTPPKIADFMVRQIDRSLVTNFGLPDGICDRASTQKVALHLAKVKDEPLNGQAVSNGIRANSSEPFVQLLEPSVGSGVFLEAWIRQACNRFLKEEAASSQNERVEWSQVAGDLLSRTTAFDILPGPLACCWLRIAACLQQTDFDFHTPAPIRLVCGNPIESPPDNVPTPTLIVGNPPYGMLSDGNKGVIRSLIRGEVDEPAGRVSYLDAGEPIRERKSWLYDEYVKFFRWCHWRMDQAGLGIMSLLTNRGYLDNITFRGMRYQLLRSFDALAIHDLKGNDQGQRSHSNQENVFSIGRGVCIGTFTKTGNTNNDSSGKVRYFDYSGTATEKLEALTARQTSPNPGQDFRAIEWHPAAPHFFLVPGKEPARPNSALAGTTIANAMTVQSSAIVTARDSIVIGFNRHQVLANIELLRDSSIADEPLRSQLKFKSRSKRYPQGDTRRWKLAKARQALREDPDWKSHLIRCCYRPFDSRWIYYSPAMVDWPRLECMQVLTEPTLTKSPGNRLPNHAQNLAIITRRQMLDGKPRNFFWIADRIVVDGILRSDNKGNETVFPLWTLHNGKRRWNWEPEFANSVAQTLGIRYDERVELGLEKPTDASSATSIQSFDGYDLFGYAVATFFSETYRAEYHRELLIDFPPLVVCRSVQLFQRLARHGKEIIASVLRPDAELGNLPPRDDEERLIVAKPNWSAGQIQLAGRAKVTECDLSVWNFCAGRHQVMKKWLSDRKGLPFDSEMAVRYRQIGESIAEVQQKTRAIDRLIDDAGGWVEAMCRQT